MRIMMRINLAKRLAAAKPSRRHWWCSKEIRNTKNAVLQGHFLLKQWKYERKGLKNYKMATKKSGTQKGNAAETLPVQTMQWKYEQKGPKNCNISDMMFFYWLLKLMNGNTSKQDPIISRDSMWVVRRLMITWLHWLQGNWLLRWSS